MNVVDLSKPKPKHATGGSGRGGARRGGGAGQGVTSASRFALNTTIHLALQGIANNCLECVFKCTNKQSPMQTGGKQNVPLKTGLSVGRRPLFVPGC